MEDIPPEHGQDMFGQSLSFLFFVVQVRPTAVSPKSALAGTATQPAVTASEDTGQIITPDMGMGTPGPAQASTPTIGGGSAARNCSSQRSEGVASMPMMLSRMQSSGSPHVDLPTPNNPYGLCPESLSDSPFPRPHVLFGSFWRGVSVGGVFRA